MWLFPCYTSKLLVSQCYNILQLNFDPGVPINIKLQISLVTYSQIMNCTNMSYFIINRNCMKSISINLNQAHPLASLQEEEGHGSDSTCIHIPKLLAERS